VTLRVWTDNVSERDFTEADFVDIDVLDGLRLTAGDPLAAKWPDEVALAVTTEFPPADTFRCGPLRIISKKMLRVFRDRVSAEVFEALPVSVTYRGVRQTGYYYLNILESHDVLDHQKSDITIEDGLIEDVDAIVIDDSAVGDRNLFLLDALEVILFASEDLVQALDDAGCTGVAFVAPEDWKPY